MAVHSLLPHLPPAPCLRKTVLLIAKYHIYYFLQPAEWIRKIPGRKLLAAGLIERLPDEYWNYKAQHEDQKLQLITHRLLLLSTWCRSRRRQATESRVAFLPYATILVSEYRAKKTALTYLRAWKPPTADFSACTLPHGKTAHKGRFLLKTEYVMRKTF